MIKHVEVEVEDHYWEADGLNEEVLERFVITNSSDSESSDDEGVNEGFLEADSTSFGSRSESTDSSDEEVEITYMGFVAFVCLLRNEEVHSP